MSNFARVKISFVYTKHKKFFYYILNKHQLFENNTKHCFPLTSNNINYAMLNFACIKI